MWEEGYDTEPPELNLMLDLETLRLFWTTKEGKEIFIEDMETDHIKNICRADMEGRIRCGEKTQDRFILELSIREGREKCFKLATYKKGTI